MHYRQAILWVAVLIMIAGLFFSRFLLTAGIILYVLASFDYQQPLRQVKSYVSQPLLWGISLLFLVPLVSGLWSQDAGAWLSSLRIKLTLLLLPFAFASTYFPDKKNWLSLSVIWVLAITAGTWWSFGHYLMNTTAIHEGYLRAKTMLTPLENDHVRFSWLVCVAILLGGFILSRQKNLPTIIRVSWYVLLAWLIIYLHILAARTGLLCFYASCFGFAFYYLFTTGSPKRNLVWLIVLAALPFAAYFMLPTFKKRLQYVQYDLSMYQRQAYMPGSNDGMRLISIEAGWQVMQQYPLTGAGFGDIREQTKKWYKENYPEMIEEDKILPSSEWMMHGAGAGWPGFIILSIAMLIPFLLPGAWRSPFWLGINLTAALSLLFDIGLTVQFGVFLYSFLVLWFYKEVNLHQHASRD